MRRELFRASFWDRRGARDIAFCEMSLCRVWVMDWESADRSASFSGLGGMGGAGIFADEDTGRLMSKGESRRFTACGFG